MLCQAILVRTPTGPATYQPCGVCTAGRGLDLAERLLSIEVHEAEKVVLWADHVDGTHVVDFRLECLNRLNALFQVAGHFDQAAAGGDDRHVRGTQVLMAALPYQSQVMLCSSIRSPAHTSPSIARTLNLRLLCCLPDALPCGRDQMGNLGIFRGGASMGCPRNGKTLSGVLRCRSRGHGCYLRLKTRPSAPGTRMTWLGCVRLIGDEPPPRFSSVHGVVYHVLPSHRHS